MADEQGRPPAAVAPQASRDHTGAYEPRRADCLRQHTASLLELLRRHPPRHGDLMRTLTDVALVSSKALGVARTSVWLFTEQGRELACKLLLVGDREQSVEDVTTLEASKYGAYFGAIARTGVIAVEDVFDDPRTESLAEYLRAHGVRALLDISIAVPGELVGVVCHEHTASPRAWRPEEVDFAAHVADLIALALEVERRQLAEAKARGSEAKYRYLVESLPVIVYSFEPYSSKIEYLSPQIHELGVLEADALQARDVSAWFDVIHPDDRALVRARFEPGGVDRVPAEIHYRVLQKSGAVRHVRDHCRVVRDHAGEPLAIQGVIADVTEQRRAEARNVELERRFRSLLENVDMIALVLDREGRAEFVNRCFERLTGYSADQVLGADCFRLLALPDEVENTRARFLRDLERQSIQPTYEGEIRTRGGERRRILWTNTLLRNEDGIPEGTCSLGLDVTERVRFEAQLLQQTKLESMGQLAAGVAHDFNNLLTVMSAGLEQLGDAALVPADRHALELAGQALQQAGELTRSLLVYARREPVFPARVQVDALVEEMSPILTALASGKLALVKRLEARGAEVMIDRAQLRQLVMNLVGNAMDATRDHGTRVRIETRLESLDDIAARAKGAARGGGFVVLVVEDDGRGMDARTLSRALEPFFTTKAAGKGTGLGLSMCQSIVQRAGGFLTVESEPGRGTSCRAHLPLRVSAAEAAKPPAPQRASARPDGMAHVLVVEDDPLIRELILATLSPLSLHCQAVATIRAAARIAGSERVDLLITDGALPDGSGCVLARSLRAARPALRVVLVSGSPEDASEFDAMLLKPFDAASLRRTVADLLAVTTTQRPRRA